MPFYWIPRTTDTETMAADAYDAFPAYATPRDAHANRPEGEYSIHYRETLADRAEWADRELSRFENGEYAKTPWSDDDRYWLHFAHMSQKEPGKIAYTPDAERGVQDRQNILPIARYLARYYADVAESKRSEWLSLGDLKIATDADTIERLYVGRDYTSKPFYSCIGWGHTFDIHPSRVYGDSDLAIAYIGPIDACLARVVVWPAKKHFNRIFCVSDTATHDRFMALLDHAGFVPGSLNGAKIRKIEHSSGSWVMPYIDNVSGADDDRDPKFHVLGRGDVPTDSTTGVADGIDYASCENCNDRFPSDADSSPYCESCNDDRSYCEHCDTDRFDMSFFTVPGCNIDRSYSREVCESCTESDRRSRRRCELCRSSWYEWQLDESDQIERHDNGTDRFCTDCADTARICGDCDAAYEADDDDDGKCTDCRDTDADTVDGINEADTATD